MSFQKVTHAIFDLDGLLLESESVYEKILSEIIEKYGKKYTNDVKLKVLGTMEPDTCRIIVTELGLPITVDQFYMEYKAKMFELVKCQLMPGAERLLRHLHENNIPMAVATSSSQISVDLKLQAYQDLFSLFNHIVCGTSDPEVKNGKPAPDIFLVCCARFPDKPEPSQCLVFEDAPNGVKAAVSAGMQVVMVPEEGVTEDLKKPATVVLKSLEEFQPELFGLPQFLN